MTDEKLKFRFLGDDPTPILSFPDKMPFIRKIQVAAHLFNRFTNLGREGVVIAYNELPKIEEEYLIKEPEIPKPGDDAA